MSQLPGQQRPGSGVETNIASALCYVGTFIAAIIFLTLDKHNKEVKFHAYQSLLFAAVMTVYSIVVFILSFIPILATVFGVLNPLIFLGVFGLMIFCAYKAYQSSRFEIPFVSGFAQTLADKN